MAKDGSSGKGPAPADLWDDISKARGQAGEFDASVARESMAVYVDKTSTDAPILADDAIGGYVDDVRGAAIGRVQAHFGVDLSKAKSGWAKDRMAGSIGVVDALDLEGAVRASKGAPGQVVSLTSNAAASALEHGQGEVRREALYGDRSKVESKIQSYVEGNENIRWRSDDALAKMQNNDLGVLAAQLLASPNPQQLRQLASQPQYAPFLEYVQ